MRTADEIKRSTDLCSPGSTARVAVQRLDAHFGTTTHLVEDPLLLPTHIQKSMARNNFRNGAKGAFDLSSNTVYLIASNLASAKDAVMAYRHEVTGHMGVRASLGNDRDDVFEQIFRSYESDPRLEAISDRYRLDLSEPSNQLLAAEELVAHMAESGSRPSEYDRIRLKAKEDYAAVTGDAVDYSDDDIRVLLERGRDFLRQRTSFEPSADIGLRSPAELNPRLAALNGLLSQQPKETSGGFDRWLMDSAGQDLGVVSQAFENQYLMLERFSEYLSSLGVDVTEAGNLAVRSVSEQARAIIGDRPVIVEDSAAIVLRSPGAGAQLETTFDNLRTDESGVAVVADKRLAKPVSDKPDDSLRFMYVGEDGVGRLGRLDSFARASQMKMENRSSGEIWMATGWFEGPDGAWRIEISDRDAVTSVEASEQISAMNRELSNLGRQHKDGLISEAELARKTRHYAQSIEKIESGFENAREGTLPSHLNHPTLFEAYPELNNMRVILDPDAPYPEVTTNTPRIVIPASYEDDPDLFRQTLIHETQHLVQRIEGFSRGLSPFMNGQREEWERELNELLESDPDVLIYMEFHTELFDGSLRINRDQTREDMKALEEVSSSVQRMNELAERLKLINDPEAYTRSFGEIEANDSMNRQAMTEGQRRRISPYSSTMPPDREVVVHRFDDIPQAMFLGSRAAGANVGKLAQAVDLEAGGSSAEEVLAETGWFKGADGSWRFEIDDSKTALNPDAFSILEPAWQTLEDPRIASITYRKNPDIGGFDVRLVPENAVKTSEIIDLKGVSRSYLMMNLPTEVAANIMQSKGEQDWYDLSADEPNGLRLEVDFVYDASNALALNRLLDHPTLFEQYPQLKEWRVAFHPESEAFPDSAAMCDTRNQTITLFPRARYQVIRSLLHETQHAIQSIEGFAMGASPNAPDVASKMEGAQYHSEVLRAIESAPFQRANGNQWMGYLSKQPGVKKAEIQWLELNRLFEEADGPVDAELVRGFVEDQQLRIEESLSNPSPKTGAQSIRESLGQWMQAFADQAAEKGADREKVFAQLDDARATIGWQMSQGMNPPDIDDYPLIADFDPGPASPLSLRNFQAQLSVLDKLEQRVMTSDGVTEYDNYTIDGGEDYRELLIKAAPESVSERPGQDFQSSHWIGHDNVLAHVRFKTFQQEYGEKLLMIEEIQSDWRKEHVGANDVMKRYEGCVEHLNECVRSYERTEQKIADNKARLAELSQDPDIEKVHSGEMTSEECSTDTQAKLDEYDKLVAQSLTLVNDLDWQSGEIRDFEDDRNRFLSMLSQLPKDFPLGGDWFAMVGKRMLRYAAENGFDSVAWSPASVQAERNRGGNRQRLDRLEWEGHDKGYVLVCGEVDGEEVIREVLPETELKNHLADSVVKTILEREQGFLDGPDITYDARGFEQFYNQMLPKALNKFLKPWGQSVELRELELSGAVHDQIQFPTIQISPEMKQDLVGSTTPMYKARKADALDSYWRSAGEVEARAVEATYLNADLRSVHPHDRYDVPMSEQIVDTGQAVALKLGPNAIGADIRSMRSAASIASEKVLGVPEASDFVYRALSGENRSAEAEKLRRQLAEVADDINPQLKEATGWSIGESGHLRFELAIPDCRAQQSIGEIIADDIRKFAADVHNDRIPITDITATYNAITNQSVPVSKLIGDHPIMDAYPVLEDVVVRQSYKRPETRWDSANGAIIVPPDLSRAELGAYLTKGLNEAVNSMERMSSPEIQHALGITPKPAQIQRSKEIQRSVAGIRNASVAAGSTALRDADREALNGLSPEQVQGYLQASKLNLKGAWMKTVPWAEEPSIEAANEQAIEAPARGLSM
ncbi:LPD23 domain-containing protein [Marinobacter shengliensis]|uniref:LPD23 domain-containing protein n=1 Tax=Marinobacter shengliensis TaxID=1389223 RepID=UPI0011090B60|nr:LPD23 domain-containing protein [Marinobacter shengliensis]